MTVTPGISIVDGQLMVLGQCVLSNVHGNITLTPASGVGMVNGAFLGATSDQSKSHHIFPIGQLEGLRFMSLFRFKLWWMTQRMGSYGRDVPFETQFLLVEGSEGSPLSNGVDDGIGEPTIYIVFLPLLEGSFRAVLQGNENNELEICLESGDPAVETSQGVYSVFVGAGTDPYEVITSAVKAVERHSKTFAHRERKTLPDILNWFGWCTWDAFYTDVSAEGVKQGLKSLEKGGTPPKFLILDDGWQSVEMDPNAKPSPVGNTANFANRLTHIKENYKFQKDGKTGQRQEDPALGLRHIVSEAKKTHNLKYIYVWHAITGYWGGVKPDVSGMEHYNSKMSFPVEPHGILHHQPDEALECIKLNGLGLVHPKNVFQFYDDLHSYLASAGINGVKVDVQNIIETLGAGHGGRVKLASQYHQAMEASVARNFPGNGIIACMSHNTDGLYSSKQTAVIRASDDFWPRDPASHTIHIASVAYNSVFLGEFMQPDWDMFHSLHPMGEYHAAARAVGGCSIYVSDKPGEHDFDLLKKIVLPDGSLLRAQLPGRPTKDCLFTDPARDGANLLKLWNLNKHTGVIGVFNCQGAGWCRVDKRNLVHDSQPKAITGAIRSMDVDYLPKIADENWDGDSVVYSHRRGELVCLPKGAALPITLKAREYEVFTVVPLKGLANGISFAPIGLIKMFNSGGAISAYEFDPNTSTVYLKVRGCGDFGAYCSVRPQAVYVDSTQIGFSYEEECGLTTFTLKVPETELYLWDIRIDI